MKKFLRTLMLMALMMPLVSQAQETQTFFNFEDNAIPAGWTNSATHPWVITTTSPGTGHHGTYCIKSGNSSVASSTSEISATFTFVGDGSISFYGGCWGEGTSTAWDKCIFEIDNVAQFTVGALQTWQTYTFEVTPGTHTFKWKYSKDSSVNPTEDAFFVDDVEIDLGSPCARPASLVVTDFTANTIDIAWAEGTGSAWQVFISDTALVDGYPVTVTGDTTYQFLNLEPMTNYTIAVRTDCGEEISSARTITQRTACVAFDVDEENPFVENFEGTVFPPSCWTNVHTAGTGTGLWQRGTTTHASSTGSAMLPDQQTGNKTNLVTPLLSLSENEDYQVTFWMYRVSSTKPNEGVKVWVNTTPDTVNGTALIHIRRGYAMGEITETAEGWYQYYSTIPSTMTGNVYVIFEGISEYGNASYIDDIAVEKAWTCFPLTEVHVVDSLATPNSITIAWTDQDNEEASYTIYNMADTTEVEDVVIEDNVATISGLEPNTAYTFGVTPVCSDGIGDIRLVSGRTACAMISSIPWIDSLEAVPSGSNVMPFCWSRLVLGPAGSAVYPYDYNYSTYAHSGSRSLYFYWYPSSTYTTYADTVIAILPQIDIETLDLSELQLSFYGRTYSSTDTATVQVGTMSDPEDGTTFSMLNTVRVGGNTYQRYDVNLTEAASTMSYVAILMVKPTTTKYLYIDDVTLHEQPSCAYVTELHAIDSLATETSVTLAWTDANNENATYTVFVNGEPVADNVDETTYTIEDLSPSTSYTVAVQANCSDADAEMSTTSARTACGTITEFPFTESFEGGAGCWTLVSMNAVNGLNGSGSYPMGVITYNSHKVLRFSSYSSSSTGTYDQYAYSPAFSAEDDAIGYSVKVRYSTYGSSDKLYFGYITATDTMWDPVAHTTSGVSSWQNYEAYIPASATKLVVHYYGDFAYYAYIDSVVVELLDGDFCFPVANFEATEVGNYTTVLNWVEGGSAEAWQIMVNGDTNSYLEVEEVPYTMTVEPDSIYTVRVRAVCGDENMSEWSNAITFHTLVACPAPTNLHVVDSLLTATEATMAWTGFDDSYTVSYRVLSGMAGGAQGFDNSQLNGWTTIDADGDGYTWVLASAAAGVYHNDGVDITGTGHDNSYDYVVSGSYSNALASALTPDNYLVSPQVTLGGSISFWASAQDASYAAEHFGVAVSTTSNTSAAAFTTIDEWTMTAAGTPDTNAKAQGTWGLYTVDLSAYAGQTGYVAIRHFDCEDEFILNIDDITITVPGEDAPAEEPWTTTTTTDNFVNLTGLTSNTTYEFMLQGLCGTEDTTAWMSTTFTTLPTCTAVTNVAAVDVTSNSITLSWLDRNAAGATYIVTDAQGNEYTTTSIADTGCVITDLSADSLYNIVVKVVCAAGDTSSAAILNVRTLCDAIAIPYMEDFEATSAHLNCWSVYNIASSTGLSTTGGINNSGCFKFAYNTNPPQYLISPMLDIPEGDSVLFEFRYKAHSSYYIESFQVGYSYTGNSISDFTWGQEITTGVTSYQLYSQMLSDSVKFVAIKYTANDQYYLYIDSLYIGLPPTCFPVTNLTASNVTASSITLSWEGTSTSYSIYNGTDYVANTTATTYTFNGLTASTAYTFGVRGVCAADDSAAIVTINARTECGAMSLPFTENFDASLSSNPCWAGSTSITADEVFNGGSLTLGDIGWIYSDAESNGLPAGHYRVNIYGTTCKKWLVTPQIDLSTVASAELTFKAAFTKYSGTSVADTDNIADDKFMVIVSTDGGQTWLQANATNISLPSLASLTYQTVTVDMTSYVGNTVRIAFYGESTVSGNDNNLHIDSISVTGSGEPIIPDTTYYTLTVTVNDATLGSVSATGLTNGTGTYVEGTNVALTATPANNAEFVGWVVNNGTDTIRTNPYTVTMNANKTVKAFFKARVGIADIDMTNVKIYSTADKVIVIGAEGRQVYVFDVNGRMIQSVKAKEHEEFVMAADGVYLVKVGNAAARRVVVIR